jgi:hypothetical protein
MLEICKQVHERLVEGKVNHIFIKTFLNHSIVPSDLDILIEDEKGFRKAERLFKREGYELKKREKYKTLCVKDNIRLDLHRKVSWEGIVFLEGVKAKNIKINSSEFPIPIPEHDFLITCSHAIFGKKTMEKHDIKYINDLYSVVNLSICFKISEQYGWDWALKSLLNYLHYSKHNYRLYKVFWILPVGLMKKALFELRQGNSDIVTNLLRYICWKITDW